MTATVISEPLMIASQEIQSLKKTNSEAQIEIEVKCDCCGFTEECTPAYIERIRERYAGKWICGLCAEAVKDEIVRSARLLSTEEALARQFNICRKFSSSTDPAVDLISAVWQILRRRLECPRGVRSTPTSPIRGSDEGDVLSRSGSCFPDISS